MKNTKATVTMGVLFALGCFLSAFAEANEFQEDLRCKELQQQVKAFIESSKTACEEKSNAAACDEVNAKLEELYEQLDQAGCPFEPKSASDGEDSGRTKG